MTTENTLECQQADALLDEGLSEPPPEGDLSPASRELRLLRALEYQEEALAKKSKRDASLGALNAGLVRIAILMEHAIEEALAGEPPTLERIRQIEPALNDHLRLTRQIDRFAQFDMRLDEKRKVSESAQGKLQKLAIPGRM